MCKIEITFTEGVKNLTHIFRTDDYYGIYERVMQHTGNHALAESVANFAELNAVGDEYYCDELQAIISDD